MAQNKKIMDIIFILSFKAQTTKIYFYKLITKSHIVLYLSFYWCLDVKEFDAATLEIAKNEELKLKKIIDYSK